MDYEYLTKNNLIVIRRISSDMNCNLSDASVQDIRDELIYTYLRSEDEKPNVAREHYFKNLLRELCNRLED